MNEVGIEPIEIPVDGEGVAADPGEPGDPWSRFDAWTQNSFALLALLGGLAFLLLIGTASGAGALAAVLMTIAMALAVGPLVAIVVGIRRGISWARPAAVAALWAFVISGAIELVTGFLVPKLTIPLGAILALVVLRTRPTGRPVVAPRDRRIALALGGLLLMMGVVSGISTFLTYPPAALIANPDDLRLSVRTNCDEPGFVPGVTDVAVTVAWKWTRRDVLPGLDDAFQVEWSPLAGLNKHVERGIVAGDLATDPVGPAATQLDQPEIADLSNVTRYGLAGASAAAADGSMQVLFSWEGPHDPAFADFVVTWAHGSRWTTNDRTVCAWPATGPPEPSTAP